MSRTFAAVAALTLILAAPAQRLKTAETSTGKTFVDGKGMTLYNFDKGCRRKIDVQRSLRGELAASVGRRRCQADRPT
jgi:predicted lipoprotein with Yx(FWY)xxD motif